MPLLLLAGNAETLESLPQGLGPRPQPRQTVRSEQDCDKIRLSW